MRAHGSRGKDATDPGVGQEWAWKRASSAARDCRPRCSASVCARAVGGLMVRGAPEDQERTVAEALEAGINYFFSTPRRCTATASPSKTSAAS